MDGGFIVLVLVIAAGLGFIPASIAKRKGYSFGLWWFYGWLLFIVAIIHVSLISDKNSQVTNVEQTSSASNYSHAVSGQRVVEELKKYKELLDQGVLTEEEFKAKKEQLLKLL